MSRLAHLSRIFFRLSLSVLLLAGATFVFLNRQQLLDHYMVWQYKPTPAMTSIADRAAFNDKGKFLFYASHPELLKREAFNDACRSVSTEQTAILGCYSSYRIYLFDIDDERLDGVKEVTAAHEMLHAAYQRLSEKEKSYVDNLLEQQSLGESEERLVELMAQYEVTQPGERHNELHSILGSELRSLSPELEEYYSQYFTDRLQLVDLSESYQSVFDDLKNRQESLASTLNELADRIEREGAVYRRNLMVLDNDVEIFNRDASSGSMTRSEYDSRKSGLESRQAQLRQSYQSIQSMLREHEQKRAELAAINSESNALNRSINSSLTPVPDSIDG